MTTPDKLRDLIARLNAYILDAKFAKEVTAVLEQYAVSLKKAVEPVALATELQRISVQLDAALNIGQVRHLQTTASDCADRLAVLAASLLAPDAPSLERKPLTDEWILSMCGQAWVPEIVKTWVRAIEAAHGITDSAALAKEQSNGNR